MAYNGRMTDTLVRPAPARARFEARTSNETLALFREAARALQTSQTDFVLGAATEKALKVLARSDQTLMSPSQFDDMMDSLDAGPKVREPLVALLSRPRRFVRQ